MEHSAIELLEMLNTRDECTEIEAKRSGQTLHSAMQTVSAFSNEPGLGGGYLLFGVSREDSLFPAYTVIGIEDTDQLQRDVATQCAGMFNLPVRPEIIVEPIGDKNIVVAFIRELTPEQKPLFLKADGLPAGAYRRIGSTDHRCTEDDLRVFYQAAGTASYDSSKIDGSSLDDIDPAAIETYRRLRGTVNPNAEELTYSDEEMLQALGCIAKNDSASLTLAGLMLFGKGSSQRRLIPMMRVDYIRVPGSEWIQDPDNRFTTVDMRGPLLQLVYRAVEAVNADLPKGFVLPEGELQAGSTGLPLKVLREAVVNGLMHRSYRENRPTQIIRYDNRIELRNPGYSLKPDDSLGEPGSETRNPLIAAVFHETNLAETKGSGIRVMRSLMLAAQMTPPTFESDREGNTFTARLLLHHFLSPEDLEWLSIFRFFDLNDSQKKALIFVREVGAIDNKAYRQLSEADVLRASQELRALRDLNLLDPKGRGRSTYYVPSDPLATVIQHSGKPLPDHLKPLSDQFPGLSDQLTTLPDHLPQDLKKAIESLGRRTKDAEKVNKVICDLCAWRPLSSSQLSRLLQRHEKYLLEHFINPLRESGRIQYTIPDLPNHPNQMYTASKP
jgi:ATP-dependent DNA helicase RecG